MISRIRQLNFWMETFHYLVVSLLENLTEPLKWIKTNQTNKNKF